MKERAGDMMCSIGSSAEWVCRTEGPAPDKARYPGLLVLGQLDHLQRHILLDVKARFGAQQRRRFGDAGASSAFASSI